MVTRESQKMGLAMAIIVTMNAMIGAGIFLVPEQLQRTVGPAGLITYLIVIGAVWSIAYSLARVVHYYPHEGSFYTYVQAWAGKNVALAAAFLYCIGLIVALGLLTRMTGVYLHTLFPAVPAYMLSTLVLALLAASIVAGARILKGGQIVLLVLTLLPLIIITLLCLSKAQICNLSPFMPYGANAILKATRIVVFGFLGFEAVTGLHALVSRPDYTVPKAITWSILAVSAVYVTFVASTFLGIPRSIALQSSSLSDALYALFPQHSWLITFILWGIIITIMGTIHAMLWSVGTLLQSLIPRAQLPFKAQFGPIIILLSVLIWASSIVFKSEGLFFDITALCIIIALAAALWPLASNLVKCTKRERIIAIIGLISASIMCGYALQGIWKYITS